MTMIYILFLINTVLLVWIGYMIEELWRKKRLDDWIEESKHEAAEEKSLIKMFGSYEKLIAQNPTYVGSKLLKKLRLLGLPKKEISMIIAFFMGFSVKGKKMLMENFREYLLATPDEKIKVLEKWGKL